MQRLQRMANKAMKDYAMLTDGDRIMIGLSGGKDSLALVEVLAARQKIFKPKIEVIACHVSVDNVPYQSDIEYLKSFCEARGVKFIHKTTSFDEDTKDGRGPCFLCAWNRRKTLFKAAEEFGCTKLALGHHKDDILETLLMNQIFQGAYATMPPVLKMAKFDINKKGYDIEQVDNFINKLKEVLDSEFKIEIKGFDGIKCCRYCRQ